MKNFRQEIGKKGENKAIDFLKKKGYQILETNYRTRFGEIDIIAEENNDIVFIEVKTRTNYSFGAPQLAVDLRKQKKIIKTALNYIKTKNILNKNFRFDVVAQIDNNIELIKNAFCCPSKYNF
ncbi:MAG: YraN family protein [Endomicrobiia bacterium]